VCKLFPAVTSVTMALDLEDSGRQRKTAENSEGAANIFAVLLLVGSSVSQDFCGMQGIDG